MQSLLWFKCMFTHARRSLPKDMRVINHMISNFIYDLHTLIDL